MRHLIISTLVCLLLPSCTNYYKDNRRAHLIQSEYSNSNTIVIKDAIICSYIDKFFSKKEPVEVNRDSVFDIFTNAFSKLACNFEYVTGNKYCNSSFITYNTFKYRLFDFEELHSMVVDDSLVLIPLIGYFYIPNRNFYITSTGMPGGGGFSKNVHIQLAVLIFKNQELIYYMSRRFFSESVTTKLETDNIDFIIKQENIDTLVQLTMKDYIERLR